MQPQAKSGRRSAAGVTLLELLIVIAILAMVTAATIPLMLSGAEGRRLRESARLVGSYFATARSRAIETGLPCGVMVQRASTTVAGGSPWYSMNLVAMEVQPPYSGDFTTSVASGVTNNRNGTASLTYLGTAGGSPDVGWQGLVRAGDVIKFNFQGRGYLISSTSVSVQGTPLTTPPSSIPWILTAVDGTGAVPTAAIAASLGTTGGLPYQIFRQPTASAVQPLQLPEGTVIDLAPAAAGSIPAAASSPSPAGYPGTSGFGGSYYFFVGGLSNGYAYPNPIVVFNPTGGVDSVYDGNSILYPTSPIFFLVGRRAGAIDVNTNLTSAPPPNSPPGWTPNNLYDLGNFWISIGATTGLVATSENANISASTNLFSSSSSLAGARAYAQSAQSVGGR